MKIPNELKPYVTHNRFGPGYMTNQGHTPAKIAKRIKEYFVKDKFSGLLYPRHNKGKERKYGFRWKPLEGF